jgi:hypothetical protein
MQYHGIFLKAKNSNNIVSIRAFAVDVCASQHYTVHAYLTVAPIWGIYLQLKNK